MKYVKVIPISSNDEISHIVYLDQTTDYDGTPVIDDSAKPAKTLQAAITAASSIEFPCKVVIKENYVISGKETISKTSNNKVVVTCDTGKVITGFAASASTALEPHIIKDGSVYKLLAANCHKLDAEHYLSFVAKSVENQTYVSGIYEQDVTMDIPSGYTLAVGMLIDLQIGWVNAVGPITSVDTNTGEMVAHISSANYQMKQGGTGKYRIENYGSDSNAFKFTESSGTYTISGDTTNVKTIQPSRLSLSGVFNLVFENCTFEGLDKEKDLLDNTAKCGISISNCYALRFEGCKFEYCNRLLGSGNKDITVNNCYFNNTTMRVYCTKLFVRNSLFKTSELLAGYGGVIENNEFCYSFKGIYGGIHRREANSSSVNERTIIQRNEFHHIGLLMQGDYGVIYIFGQVNMIIQYNYLHDCIGGTDYGSLTGIYFDEGCYGILARYNLIVNCTSNSYTHYGRGNVLYNNLFAYPAICQIRYSAKVCYEAATSYIANIFYNGDFFQDYMENMANDNSIFQFNVADKALYISDSHFVHDNEKAVAPIPKASKGNFEVNQIQIGKIGMGASNVRNYNQSTIDTTFFKPTNASPVPSPEIYKYNCGLPSTSDWISERGISVDFTEVGYDKWFIDQEMSMFNITNDYLTNLLTI